MDASNSNKLKNVYSKARITFDDLDKAAQILQRTKEIYATKETDSNERVD